ncbi:MAG: AAA family ATPase [bacterium]|nr:AAA family ATPase [bacterium]MDZ4299948.1 AAA family ATPase [Candidatus Sungbacteria bacterium]
MKTPFLDFKKNKFFGALVLERYFPRQWRRTIRVLADIGLVIAVLLVGYSAVAFAVAHQKGVAVGGMPPFSELPPYNELVGTGILIFSLGIRLCILSLNAYIRSLTLEKKGDPTDKNLAGRMDYYVATLAYTASRTRGGASVATIAKALPRTAIGREFLKRLGMNAQEYAARTDIKKSERPAYLEPQKTFAKPPLLADTLPANGEITFVHCADILWEHDEYFQKLCFARGLTKDDVTGTAEWASGAADEQDRAARWWRRERLARIPGFAKGWAYGRTYLLDRFGTELTTNNNMAAERITGRESEVEKIETALLKRSGANALIIGEPGAGRHAIIAAFAEHMREGRVHPALEHKRIIELQFSTVTGAGKTKGETESLLITLFNEAVRAGNIILLISDLPAFVSSLGALGIGAGTLLAPYLEHSGLHLIATADTARFRQVLESDAGLMKYFERVELTEPDPHRLLAILEDHALVLETTYRNRIIITYSTLIKAVDGAVNHIVIGALPQRAIQLLEEATAHAVASHAPFLIPEHINAIVLQKTNMPSGAIGKEEQGALLDMEERLCTRVIGQDEATAAIADTIRRARTGIRNPSRPIGSFLFLGPTGVGKTETAKALAAVYFGNEEAMLRFDMSEYATQAQAKQLLGSFAKGEPGLLASRIRRAPYAVLLLDEFEKSHSDVRNIFLQILDEGFFSDHLGKHVNLRNAIIIATSNAGALEILELVQKGGDPVAARETLIAHIEQKGIFSPELLNRFDSLVIFRPLDENARRAVAKLLLEKLVARLKRQNYLLTITPELIDTVATRGYHPELGARPMQRFIQDKIEKTIANRMIKGELTFGTPFSLSPADIA